MITHPTSAELIDAVTRFLEERVAPQMRDRDVFLVRVAVNALSTVKRESEAGAAMEAGAKGRVIELLGHDGEFTDLNHELCEAIRTETIADDDPKLLAHLRASAIAQIGIDQPNYAGLKQALSAGGTDGAGRTG